MVTHVHRPLRVVVYEGEGTVPLAAERSAATLAALLDRGYAVTRSRPGGATLPADDHTLLVLGDFAASSVPAWTDEATGVPIPTHDIAPESPEAVVSWVEQQRQQASRPMNQPGQWKPWFPVIDYDRCTNCLQCLSFCLFDVYDVTKEGKIQVQNNDNCKTNCPACSRVCPEVAIMFPKYHAGPINGDRIDGEDVRREKMKIDISALLGGDVYAKLRDRSAAAKSRFSKERSSDKALAERQKCLTKLVSDGFIPAEVLAALPSPEEIAQKAAAAQARVQAVLAQQNPA